MTYAHTLVNQRLATGLTARRFAQEADLDPALYAEYERGAKYPQDRNRIRIDEALEKLSPLRITPVLFFAMFGGLVPDSWCSSPCSRLTPDEMRRYRKREGVPACTTKCQTPQEVLRFLVELAEDIRSYAFQQEATYLVLYFFGHKLSEFDK